MMGRSIPYFLALWQEEKRGTCIFLPPLYQR